MVWSGGAWGAISGTANTLNELLAITGTAGQSVKCLDPMFGSMGGMFDWSVSLAKWVPRNVRIYGVGVGTVYSASAGDINTDVQVATLAIPTSLVFPGIMAAIRGEVKRNLSAGTTLTAKVTNNAQQVAQVNVTLGHRNYFQGFAKCAIDTDVFTKSGLGTNGHGFGGVTVGDFAPSAGAYTFAATLLATTAGMSQAVTALYAELSFEGVAS